MLLTQAIEALTVATIADGRSHKTAHDYGQRLAMLAAFLGDRDVASITADDLRRFVADLRSRDTRYTGHVYRPVKAGGLSPATVAGHVRAIKRLFSFLVDDGVIDGNPARRLKVQKLPKGREPKAISLEDLQAMLAATAGDDAAQLRDRALLLFLTDTGCRVGGLVGLRLADLDLESGAAWVIEKGSKRRAVFFTERTAEALARWLAIRPEGSDRVFVRVDLRDAGQGLTALGVSQILRRVGLRAGVTGAHNPHSFRHAFAREYLGNGGDLATLADLLGHADIGTTSMYLVFSVSELQVKHDRFSPVPKLEL